MRHKRLRLPAFMSDGSHQYRKLPDRVVCGFWLLMAAVILIHAESSLAGDSLLFHDRHQTGARLGMWANSGESPVASDPNGMFETNFHDACFYIEGFLALRLSRPLMLELSAGVVNRGSVTFIQNNITNHGSVQVHPILVQLKFYPLFATSSRLQPYLLAGGGLYYGRRSVQFTTSSNIYYGIQEQTGTDINYTLGGGCDWPLGSTVGLEAAVKYMPVQFSKGLQTISNYEAVALTVGIKYLYTSKKK
ncbi:MAG: hypothetical protein ABII79_13065 [bacterium]